MKRLVPAVIILSMTIFICITAHTFVNRACDNTIKDIELYYNKKISSQQLEDNWQNRKENMALFVNHGFLDKISIYIGQLTVFTDNNLPENETVYKNIKSVLSLIKAEQRFGLHSFY